MKIKNLLNVFLIMLFVSCGTSNVQTVKTTNKDLSIYDTFAYLPNTNVDVPGENYNDETVNERIVEAINQNMRQAGYVLDRENPDLLVLVKTKTDQEIATNTDPMYATYPYTYGAVGVSPFYDPYYYRGYGAFGNIVGYDTDTYQYTDGTLVIYLVDRETKNVVWKGIASDNIYDETTTDAIREMVNEIFEKYPLTKE